MLCVAAKPIMPIVALLTAILLVLMASKFHPQYLFFLTPYPTIFRLPVSQGGHRDLVLRTQTHSDAGKLVRFGKKMVLFLLI